jgi:hypothetical protein
MLSRSDKEQSINIKLFDFIKVDPAPILNIFFSESEYRLYVSRSTYSEIYSFAVQEDENVTLQQIT